MKGAIRFSLLSGRLFWVFVFLTLLFFGGGMFEMGRDLGRSRMPALIGGTAALAALSFVGFLSGFALAGRILKDRWLEISSLLAVLSWALVLALPFLPELRRGIPAELFEAVWSAAAVLFGTGLLRLAGRFGGAARWAGWLEIVSGLTALPSRLSVPMLLFIPGFIAKRALLRRVAQGAP